MKESKMPEQDRYDVQHVVYISTNVGTGCEHCGDRVGLDKFAESINHYMKEHGYRVLHVGTETAHANEGLWHSTVAVLGK